MSQETQFQSAQDEIDGGLVSAFDHFTRNRSFIEHFMFVFSIFM